MRKFLAAGAASTLVLALAGCAPSVLPDTPTTASQPNVIGDIVVEGSACTAELGVATPACSDLEGSIGPVTWAGEWIIAIRVPEAAVGPDSFTSSDTGRSIASGQTLTFTRNDSLSQALEDKNPTDAATKWVGYASPYTTAQDNQFTYSAPFKFPGGGTFTYTALPGFRQTDVAGANAPYSCTGVTLCPPVVPLAVVTDATLATRDLAASLPADGPTIQQGSAGASAADFVFKGTADPTAKFNLTGSSPLDGAALAFGTPVLEPGTDSTTSVPLSITVPDNAPPGDYPFTVRAAVDGHPGEFREASSVLHVTAKPQPPQQQQPQTPQQPTTPAGSPRLSVTTSVSPSRARPGKAVNLTLVVANMGTADAQGVKVCQKPFGRTTLVSTKPKAASTRSGQCFTVGSLAAGKKSSKLSVKVRVNSGARAGTVNATGTATATGLPAVQHTATLTILKAAKKKKKRG